MSPEEKTVKQSVGRWWKKIPGGYRTVSIILSGIIIVIVVAWRPWVPNIRATDRTVSVTGTATVTATPDQYTFSPSYNFTNSDKQAALNTLTAKSEQLIAGLKALGVASADIKTNVSGTYNYGYYMPIYMGDNTYTLSLTATIHDATLAQKVQDYLVTTSPTGSVTPSVTFSTAKQHTLQAEARDQAERDARTQADQSAHNLGFTVGSVKSVDDGNLFTGGPIMYGNMSTSADAAQPSKSSLTIQPGQNDLSYSVQVIYYIH